METVAASQEPAGKDAPAQESATAAEAPAGATKKKRTAPSVSLAQGRTAVAQVIWILCLVAATSLAVAALCIAVDANQNNGLVTLVLDLARFFDLGVFTIDDGIMAFTGDNADTKNALVNYGLGAAFYLVLGRVLERLVRP